MTAFLSTNVSKLFMQKFKIQHETSCSPQSVFDWPPSNERCRCQRDWNLHSEVGAGAARASERTERLGRPFTCAPHYSRWRSENSGEAHSARKKEGKRRRERWWNWKEASLRLKFLKFLGIADTRRCWAGADSTLFLKVTLACSTHELIVTSHMARSLIQ